MAPRHQLHYQLAGCLVLNQQQQQQAGCLVEHLRHHHSLLLELAAAGCLGHLEPRCWKNWPAVHLPARFQVVSLAAAVGCLEHLPVSMVTSLNTGIARVPHQTAKSTGFRIKMDG